MNISETQTAVGLADGKIVRYEKSDSTLVVHIKAWNESSMRIAFKDVLLILDSMAGDISGLYSHNDETDLMRKALAYAYDDCPKGHLYKHHVFLNNDGHPCFDIIAAEMEVSPTSLSTMSATAPASAP